MSHQPDRPGLRERKKRRTRAVVQDAALELFLDRGYRATTLAAIAERADVALRTVSVHFPAKKDLLFSDDPFDADALERRLSGRRPDESTMDVLRDWMVTTMQDLDAQDAQDAHSTGAKDPDPGRVWRRRAARARLIAQDDQLRGRARAGYLHLEQVLAVALANDLQVAADALVIRLASLAVVGGLREVVYASHEAQTTLDATDATNLMPLVQHVLDFVQAGTAAITSNHSGKTARP